MGSPHRWERGHIPWCAGKHFSEEHRQKISATLKQWYVEHPMSDEVRRKHRQINSGQWKKGRTVPKEQCPMFGKHHTEEWKRKMSLARKGHTTSEETRRKISEANKGKHSGQHISEEVKLQISNSMKSYWKNHPEQVQEIADKHRKPCSETRKWKISEGLKNHYKNHGHHPMKGKPEFREKMLEVMAKPDVKRRHAEAVKAFLISHPERSRQASAAVKLLWENSEYRRRASETSKALWLNGDYRERCSEASRKRWVDPKFRQMMGSFSKKRWTDQKFREKVFRKWLESMKVKPNRAELKLLTILNTLVPNQYRYTGDGSMIVAGKMPDFVNVNGQKKIIELFGQRWHEPQEEPERIAHFKRFGWDCIVIWEIELKDTSTLQEKILSFVNGGI